jgi:hypothetical protein
VVLAIYPVGHVRCRERLLIRLQKSSEPNVRKLNRRRRKNAAAMGTPAAIDLGISANWLELVLIQIGCPS